MKIIASSEELEPEFEKIKEFLSEIKEGIVLFCEGSFDQYYSCPGVPKRTPLNWTLDELAEYSAALPMTIVGEKDKRIHIVKNGKVVPAQIASPLERRTEEDEVKITFDKCDKLYNVSYDPTRKVRALSRVCGDGLMPYIGKGKADLLLIASYGTDWSEELDKLLQVHKESLKEDALIVQANAAGLVHFIYSLRDGKMIGKERISSKGRKYVMYKF